MTCLVPGSAEYIRRYDIDRSSRRTLLPSLQCSRKSNPINADFPIEKSRSLTLHPQICSSDCGLRECPNSAHSTPLDTAHFAPAEPPRSTGVLLRWAIIVSSVFNRERCDAARVTTPARNPRISILPLMALLTVLSRKRAISCWPASPIACLSKISSKTTTN